MISKEWCATKKTNNNSELSDKFAMSHTHPHTPETLLDLLRMGTELETAETRIQKALRACILISLVTALKKEGKRARDQSQSTLSLTTHDSTVDESFSKVEQLLHMHQILPDSGIPSAGSIYRTTVLTTPKPRKTPAAGDASWVNCCSDIPKSRNYPRKAP